MTWNTIVNPPSASTKRPVPPVMVDVIVVVFPPAGASTANVAAPVSVSPLAAAIVHALRPG